MNTKLLLVEDDLLLIENLTAFLTGEGFSVTSARGQKEALAAMDASAFDLVLLDITLPDGNGYSLCTALKSMYETPVIFLTALSDEFSVVTGLDMGADDYISKPFRPRELLSRIKTVLRRTNKHASLVFVQDLTVDLVRGLVMRDGQDLFLSALEYRLFLVFLNHKGMLLSRNALLEEIWDAAGEYVNDNTLTVYIKRLREKIEKNPQSPVLIKTVRGLGYKLEDTP